jgi:tRNA(Ile)-lysidine synthase
MKKKTISKSTFLKRIKDTIRQYDMLHEGDKVLIAVSGGADSVCLLEALVSLRKGMGIDIVVANMDHCLRGKESERDSSFVRELSSKLDLPFAYKKVNVRSAGKRGTSTEEQAREKRYAFLREAAGKNGCGVIATGHTMDDQAETVLMRVVYGASPLGLAGIPPVRDEGSCRLIRPLIRVGREEIIAFLKKGGSSFVEDSSNKNVRFLRNSLRLEVLPFLEKYNPKLKRSLVNLSDAVREDLAFLESEQRKIAGKYANSTKVAIKDMILQPKALRKQVFKALFKRAGGNVKKLTYRHWMDMDQFLRTADKGKSLDFPGDIRVTKKRDELVFGRRSIRLSGK